MSNYEKIKNNKLRSIILVIIFITFFALLIVFNDFSFLNNLKSPLNIFYLITATFLSVSFIYLKPLPELFTTIIQDFTSSKKYSYYTFLSQYSIKNILCPISTITKDNFYKFKSQNIEDNKIKENQIFRCFLFFEVLYFISVFLFLINYNEIKKNLSFYFYIIFLILALGGIFLSFIFIIYIFKNKFKKNKRKIFFFTSINHIISKYIFKNYFKYFIIKILTSIILFLPALSIIFLLLAFNINLTFTSAILIIGVFFILYNLLSISMPFRYLLLSDIISYIFLTNLINLNYKNIIFVLILYRFITTYFMIITGEIFDSLIKFKNINQSENWSNRITNLIIKRYKNLPYNAIYLSDKFDTQNFLKIYSTFKILNINFLILAKEIKNNLKLPQNDNFKLIKINQYYLKQNLKKYIKLYNPEIFITDTTEYFGLNCKKIAFENNIPFLYIPNNLIKENSKKDLFIKDATLSFLDNFSFECFPISDKILSIDNLNFSNQSKLKEKLNNLLNIYNINRLKNNPLSILIMENQNIINDKIINLIRNGKNKITLFTNKIYNKIKNVRVLKGDFLNQKSLYTLFKKYNFDLVLDMQVFENSQDIIFAYDLFLNLMLTNRCNYHIKVDFVKKLDYITKYDPIINTAIKLNILNLEYLKLPQIILNDTNNENDLKYISILKLYDEIKNVINNLKTKNS